MGEVGGGQHLQPLQHGLLRAQLLLSLPSLPLHLDAVLPLLLRGMLLLLSGEPIELRGVLALQPLHDGRLPLLLQQPRLLRLLHLQPR